MTWSKFDDAAAKSPKAMVAGNEAWALWAAAVMYCNRHLTDGYVSLAALATECLPVPIPLAKAKKLAELLCAAQARPDGAGLFEPAGNQLWKVHDFLDWNPSKAEVEAKRKADRDRKRGRVDSDRDSERNSETIPRGIPSGSHNGKREDSSAPRASARAQPVPTSPDPAQPDLKLESAASAAPLAKPAPRRWRRVPADWQPKPDHLSLAIQIGADLNAEVPKFKDHEFRDPKSDPDATFRAWLRRSIELRRGPVVVNGSQRAGDALERQMARTQALRDLERTTAQPAPKALP